MLEVSLDLSDAAINNPTPVDPYAKGDSFDPSRLAWVMDTRRVEALCAAILRADEIAFDTETTGLDEHATRESAWGVAARVSMLTVTLTDPVLDGDVSNWVVPLSHPQGPFSAVWRSVLTRVAEALRDARAPLIAHHGKFDARWVIAHSAGIDLSGRLGWDTQVVAHLQDENRSSRLKVIASERFDIARWDDFDLSTPGASERVPLIELGEYAARDTYWTWREYRAQRRDLFLDEAAADEPPVTDEEYQDYRLGKFATLVTMPTVRTLTKVEQTGMCVDLDWIDTEVSRMTDQRDETLEDLLDRYPAEDVVAEIALEKGEPESQEQWEKALRAASAAVPSFAPTSRWFLAWSRIAVQAGHLRVDATTPQGKPQWSRYVLTRQAREGSGVAQTLLDYRHAVKRLEFLTSWREGVTPGGRVHASYNIGRVMTGRLSSSNPNMQQVTKTLKPAFVPSPGYLLAEIDYSQIELRVAAYLSRCEPMLDAYRRGDDLHRLMAAKITGKTAELIDGAERQKAKAANFGLLYLQSPEGFQTYADQVYGVPMTAAEAQEVHALFFDQWPGMRAWQMSLVEHAERYGWVESPLGRVRRLPDIWSGNTFLQSTAQRQAVNSPVQSFASDLMQISAASVVGEYGHEPVHGARPVGTVHDSLVVEVLASDWRRITARVMRRMLSPHAVLARLGVTLDVPLAAEATVGTRWGLADVGTIEGDNRLAA